MHQPGKQLFAWIDNSAAQSLQYTEEIIYVSAPHELKPATLDQQASPKVHPPLAPGGGKGGSIFVGSRCSGPTDQGDRDQFALFELDWLVHQVFSSQHVTSQQIGKYFDQPFSCIAKSTIQFSN